MFKAGAVVAQRNLGLVLFPANTIRTCVTARKSPFAEGNTFGILTGIMVTNFSKFAVDLMRTLMISRVICKVAAYKETLG